MPKRNYSKDRQGNTKVSPTKPWRAQLRFMGEEVYLGMFATREDALEVEARFRLKKGLPTYNPKKATKLA